MTEGNIFLVPGFTFVLELIGFVLTLAVVAKFPLPLLRKAMAERADNIRNSIQAAEEARREAERLAAERRQLLESARAEARSIIDQANQTAEQLREEGRQRGQEEYERLLEAARTDIEQQRRRAQEEVMEDVGDLVLRAAERVDRRRPGRRAAPRPRRRGHLRRPGERARRKRRRPAADARARARLRDGGLRRRRGEGRLDAVARGLADISRLFLASEELRTAIIDPSIPAQPRAGARGPAGRQGPRGGPRRRHLQRRVRAGDGTAEDDRTACRAGRGGRCQCGCRRKVSARVADRAERGLRAHPGYAERIFETIASREDVDLVEESSSSSPGSPRPRRSSGRRSGRRIPLAPRVAVLTDLLEGRVRLDTQLLCIYVLRAGRAPRPCGALESLVELAAAEQGRRLADVRSAIELDDDERDRLSEALARIARRPVELRVNIDPAVIGGLRIIVGDTIIDGTVRHRLEQLRESLLQPA